MTEYVRARNASTGDEADVPKDALAILAASGWEVVSKKDADASAKAAEESLRQTEHEMTQAGLAAIPEDVRPAAVAMQQNVADASAAKAEPKSGGK